MNNFRGGSVVPDFGDAPIVGVSSGSEATNRIRGNNVAEFHIFGPSASEARRFQSKPRDAMSAEQSEMVQQKLHAMLDANPILRSPELKRKVFHLIEENASIRSRASRLFGLADECVDAMAPYVACRPGCSHCCHIPVAICAEEANALSKVSGLPMAQVPRRPLPVVNAVITSGRKTPCPFLSQGRCSVYAVRPMVCRLHHSLDTTPSQCDLSIPPEKSIVPKNRLLAIEVGHLSLMFNQVWGDVREFFSDEKRIG